jgi:Cellulose biosynthesis protein BcsS
LLVEYSAVLRSGCQLFLICIAPLIATTADCSAQTLLAAEGGTPSNQAPPQLEFWTGAEVFQQVWSIYAGGQFAPFGSIQQDGFRMRLVGGYGAYRYTSPRWNGLATQELAFHGSVTFADLLAGYHQQFGSLTIKILGGLTATDRVVDDPDARDTGTRAGGKAVIETWWNVTDQVWTSVDFSWSTLGNVYGSRARIGWRWWPQLSVGLEGGATGSWDYDTARIGGFARYEWPSGEMSVSGGVSGDGPSSGFVDVHGAFATINVLKRF